MIDVLIPNYNGAAILPVCLDALRCQTRTDFVVTVVDDCSTDTSLEVLRTRYPEVHVIALSQNHGFAAAVNHAIAATSRPFVVLLNNDTEPEPGWLAALIGGLENHPEYDFAASKLRLYDRREILHSTGDGYQVDGLPFSRGVWEIDQGQYDLPGDVFGPCAGAAAYRRDALAALAIDGQVFDEDLVMYCEDVDLNIRARLAGFRTLYVPDAVVYHMLSATGGGALASYYCGRNFILVWSKNMPGVVVRRHLFAFLRQQLQITLAALRHVRGSAARARLRGQLAGLATLPRFLRKRTIIRQHQRLGDSQFLALLRK